MMKDPTAVHMRSIVRQLRAPPPHLLKMTGPQYSAFSATHPLKYGPSPIPTWNMHLRVCSDIRSKDFLVSQNLMSGDLEVLSVFGGLLCPPSLM